MTKDEEKLFKKQEKSIRKLRRDNIKYQTKVQELENNIIVLKVQNAYLVTKVS